MGGDLVPLSGELVPSRDPGSEVLGAEVAGAVNLRPSRVSEVPTRWVPPDARVLGGDPVVDPSPVFERRVVDPGPIYDQRVVVRDWKPVPGAAWFLLGSATAFFLIALFTLLFVELL